MNVQIDRARGSIRGYKLRVGCKAVCVLTRRGSPRRNGRYNRTVEDTCRTIRAAEIKNVVIACQSRRIRRRTALASCKVSNAAAGGITASVPEDIILMRARYRYHVTEETIRVTCGRSS